MENASDAVILIPQSREKDLLFDISRTWQILRRPDKVNRDSSE